MPIKCFQRLNGRIGIGCFGIIIITYAVNCRRIFNAVFNTLKVFQHFCNITGLNACKKRRANSSQHVFFVMPAKNLQIFPVADNFSGIVPGNNKIAVLHINALRQNFPAAEPAQSARHKPAPAFNNRVIKVKQCYVFRMLVFKNVAFGRTISLHCMVAR